MPFQIAQIGEIIVTQDDDGRVHWISKASVDADGSNGQNGNPFAYREDGRGLDNNKNAGWPDGEWGGVLLDDGSGRPLSDGRGNWFSQTTYRWRGRPIPQRFVDATSVPYVVVNPIVRRHAAGAVIGCRARVTFEGRAVDAVVADVSGAGDIGEVSIRAAELLGMDASPRKGGVPGGVSFELWPGSAALLNDEAYELQPA